MKNPYRKIIEGQGLGGLSTIIEPNKFILKKSTETERLRAFIKFILENFSEEKISIIDLTKSLCLLDKALAGEINGKFLIKEDGGSRFQAISSFDHYRIILLHSLRELGLEYQEDLMLDKNKLVELSEIIWH